jgi:hypothetical protein
MRDLFAIILRPDVLEELAVLAAFALLASLAWIATELGMRRREERARAVTDAPRQDRDEAVAKGPQRSEAA